MFGLGTPPKIHKRVFNLLKPQQPPPTAWDRIYKWIITRARIVVVIAELAVVVSFVFKVGVDLQANDLENQLKAKSFELGQFALTVEPGLRSLQQKAQTYEKVWEGSNKFANVINEVHTYIANPASDIAITLNGATLVIRGGDNLDVLEQIEAKMKNSTTFKDVKLELSTEGSDVQGGQGKYVINATIIKVNSRTDLKKTTTSSSSTN